MTRLFSIASKMMGNHGPEESAEAGTPSRAAGSEGAAADGRSDAHHERPAGRGGGGCSRGDRNTRGGGDTEEHRTACARADQTGFLTGDGQRMQENICKATEALLMTKDKGIAAACISVDMNMAFDRVDLCAVQQPTLSGSTPTHTAPVCRETYASRGGGTVTCPTLTEDTKYEYGPWEYSLAGCMAWDRRTDGDHGSPMPDSARILIFTWAEHEWRMWSFRPAQMNNTICAASGRSRPVSTFGLPHVEAPPGGTCAESASTFIQCETGAQICPAEWRELVDPSMDMPMNCRLLCAWLPPNERVTQLLQGAEHLYTDADTMGMILQEADSTRLDSECVRTWADHMRCQQQPWNTRTQHKRAEWNADWGWGTSPARLDDGAVHGDDAASTVAATRCGSGPDGAKCRLPYHDPQQDGRTEVQPDHAAQDQARVPTSPVGTRR